MISQWEAVRQACGLLKAPMHSLSHSLSEKMRDISSGSALRDEESLANCPGVTCRPSDLILKGELRTKPTQRSETYLEETHS